MKITFLGTGGGRFSTISQRRMTGGFRIDNLNGINLHVDPGPGALVRTYQFGLDPRNLSGVFISHAHTDHYTDAEVLIEAMTRGMTKENGVIIGSESVFNGFKDWGPCISNYHKSKSENVVLKPGDIRKFPKFSIKGTKTIHGDPTGVGFQIRTKNINISYTTDTQYFDDLASYHEGADIFISSVIRPGSQSIRGHLCSDSFIKLLKEIKPKLAIMTHFGLKMLSDNPVVEAKKISDASGVKTLAAFDGMALDVNFRRPDKSVISSLKDENSFLYRREKQNTYQSSLRAHENDELTIGKSKFDKGTTIKKDFTLSKR
ncbi:MBL fold metallo-hydrolase [Methanobrevibacter woesei]|uniref:MBL fold metallo-hydrolase n=1 Tax=Methanobrevibacter woesei TaxID=190976 RepID=UPI0026E0773D|nr:MBL fold metallo-hydrolase [Methanobrevibacter woesei]